MKKKRFCTVILMAFVLCRFLTACKRQGEETDVTEAFVDWEEISPSAPITVTYEKNPFDTLKVATYLTKIGDTYFLADCYHNQILFHDNLSEPITEWSVLTSDVHYAHTIAGDGNVLLIDDTENNRVLAFAKTDAGYVQTKIFDNIGMRPHFVQYDGRRDVFCVWSSITGEMYYFKYQKETKDIVMEKVIKIDELYGVYVRSFTIMDDDIYFVSGHNNEKIIRADADTLEVLETYEVPHELAGMVQLVKLQDYYYMTISTDNQENQEYATIIRTKNLHELAQGNYEDIYDKFGISGGTPYYITQIDDAYYMAHHRTQENILSFKIINNEITDVKIVY